MNHIRKIPQQGYVYNVINKLIDNINYLLDYKADAVLSARSLELTVDNTTYKLNACLKDRDGNVISQIPEIDLPIEELVVSGIYDETTNKIILTLKSGQTLEIPLTDLTNGLQPKIDVNNKLSAIYISNLNTVLKTINGQSIVAVNPGDNIQIEGAVYTALPNGGIIINSSNQISVDSTIFRSVADSEVMELTLTQAINDVNTRAFDGYIEVVYPTSENLNLFQYLDDYKTPGIYKLNIFIADDSELTAKLSIIKTVGPNSYTIVQYINIGNGVIMARQYDSSTDTWDSPIEIDTTHQNNHTHDQYLTISNYETDNEVLVRAIADLQQRVAALEGNINA